MEILKSRYCSTHDVYQNSPDLNRGYFDCLGSAMRAVPERGVDEYGYREQENRAHKVEKF